MPYLGCNTLHLENCNTCVTNSSRRGSLESGVADHQCMIEPAGPACSAPVRRGVRKGETRLAPAPWAWELSCNSGNWSTCRGPVLRSRPGGPPSALSVASQEDEQLIKNKAPEQQPFQWLTSNRPASNPVSHRHLFPVLQLVVRCRCLPAETIF